MTVDVTLVMPRAVIQPVTDPTMAVIAGTTGRGDNNETEGTFRSYANGAVRLVLGSSVTRTLPVTFRALDPGQVIDLKAMAGKTLLFRDTYGRRVWCSFLASAVVDIPLSGVANDNLLTDIAITLQEITYDEEV